MKTMVALVVTLVLAMACAAVDDSQPDDASIAATRVPTPTLSLDDYFFKPTMHRQIRDKEIATPIGSREGIRPYFYVRDGQAGRYIPDWEAPSWSPSYVNLASRDCLVFVTTEYESIPYPQTRIYVFKEGELTGYKEKLGGSWHEGRPRDWDPVLEGILLNKGDWINNSCTLKRYKE